MQPIRVIDGCQVVSFLETKKKEGIVLARRDKYPFPGRPYVTWRVHDGNTYSGNYDMDYTEGTRDLIRRAGFEE